MLVLGSTSDVPCTTRISGTCSIVSVFGVLLWHVVAGSGLRIYEDQYYLNWQRDCLFFKRLITPEIPCTQKVYILRPLHILGPTLRPM